MNASIIFKITVLILLIAVFALTIFTTTWMYLRPPRVNGTSVVVVKNMEKMNKTHRPCGKNLAKTSEHRSILNSQANYSSTESSASITEINQVITTTMKSTSDDMIRRSDEKPTGQENMLKKPYKESSIEDGSKSVPGKDISTTSSENLKKSEPVTELPPDNALNTEIQHKVNESNEVNKPPMKGSDGSGNSSGTNPDDHTLTAKPSEMKDNLESTTLSTRKTFNTTSPKEEGKTENYESLLTTVKNDTTENSSNISVDKNMSTTETSGTKNDLDSSTSSANNTSNTMNQKRDGETEDLGTISTTTKSETAKNASSLPSDKDLSTTEPAETKNGIDLTTSSPSDVSNTMNPKRDGETEDLGTISTTMKSEMAKNASSLPSDKDLATTGSAETKNDTDLTSSPGDASNTTIPKGDHETESNGPFSITTKNETAVNGSSFPSDKDISTTTSSETKYDIDFMTPSPSDASNTTIPKGDDETKSNGSFSITTKNETAGNSFKIPSDEHYSTAELLGTENDIDSTASSASNTFNTTNLKEDDKIEDHETLPTATKNETDKNDSSFSSDDNIPTTESSGTKNDLNSMELSANNTFNTTNLKGNDKTEDHGKLPMTTTNETGKNGSSFHSDENSLTTELSKNKNDLNSTTLSASRSSNTTNSNGDARTENHGILSVTVNNETAGNGSGLPSDKNSLPTESSGTNDDIDSTTSSPSNVSNTMNTKGDDETKNNRPLSMTTKNVTTGNRFSFPSDEDVLATKSPGTKNDLNATTISPSNTSNPTNPKRDTETQDFGALSTTTANEPIKNVTNGSSDEDMSTTESSRTKNDLNSTSLASNTSNATNSNENTESEDHKTLSTTMKNNIANNGSSLPSDKDLSTTKSSETKDDLFSTTSSPSDASTTTNSKKAAKIEDHGTFSTTAENNAAGNASSFLLDNDTSTSESSEFKNDLDLMTSSANNTFNTTNLNRDADMENYGTLSTPTKNVTAENLTSFPLDKDVSTTKSSGSNNDLNSTTISPNNTSNPTNPERDAETEDHGTLLTTKMNEASKNVTNVSSDKNMSTTESSGTENDLESTTTSTSDTTNTPTRENYDYFDIDIGELIKQIYNKVVPSTPNP